MQPLINWTSILYNNPFTQIYIQPKISWFIFSKKSADLNSASNKLILYSAENPLIYIQHKISLFIITKKPADLQIFSIKSAYFADISEGNTGNSFRMTLKKKQRISITILKFSLRKDKKCPILASSYFAEK